MPDFDHRDPGTPEEVWQAEFARRALPELDLDVDEIVLVAAHPDDETLGAAGLLQRAASRGIRLTVVIASDGEASHPGSSVHRPAALAKMRRQEVRLAVALVHPEARLHFLGLPDGGLRENRTDLSNALNELVDHTGTTRMLLAAPWSGDGHRDHRIVGEVVAEVAARTGVRHVGYPIWLWHWGGVADPPWARARVLHLSAHEVARKRVAVSTHVTQVRPLSPLPGDEAVVHAGMRAHFDRDLEVFLDESRPAPATSLEPGWFDEFYARSGTDPWGFETRWYEERKRAIVLATLPLARIGSVLEVGCANGVLTQDLARRADRVIALDAAASAVASARTRLAGDAHVEVRRASVPGEWPPGLFDVVLLSEVGYYLSHADLDRTIRLTADALAPGGHVVACHWRHPVAEYPLTGDQVHRALGRHRGWRRLVRHEEPDFVLEMFTAADGASVAEREGLA